MSKCTLYRNKALQRIFHNNLSVVNIFMKRLLIVISLLCVFVACTNKDPTWQSQSNDSLELTKLAAKGVTDQQPADQAKEFLSHYEEVSGVRAVNHDGYLVVAVDVHHHDRFSLDHIEKSLHDDVKQNFSDMKITLSTDQKIFIELKDLEEEMLTQNISKDKIKERLKKIRSLSKEET